MQGTLAGTTASTPTSSSALGDAVNFFGIVHTGFPAGRGAARRLLVVGRCCVQVL